MKKRARNLAILIAPFLFMVFINEWSRLTIEEKPYQIYGVEAMNSRKSLKEKCSWECYHYTQFCKNNHVKIANDYFHFIDPIYNGIINSMQGSKRYSYAFANVFILVFLLPFLMFYLLIKILDMRDQIKNLKP